MSQSRDGEGVMTGKLVQYPVMQQPMCCEVQVLMQMCSDSCTQWPEREGSCLGACS
jgi:hypothetical protein